MLWAQKKKVKMFSAIYALIAALPQILALIKTLQDNQKKFESEKQLGHDLDKINKAFKDQDAKALSDLFNNTDDK